MNRLTADERSVTGRQEDVGRSQLGWLTDPANRRWVLMPFLERVLVHGGLLKRGPDRAGSDGVHSDTLGEELVAETSNHGDLGSLGHSVVEEGSCS